MDGYRIKKVLGVVTGLTPRNRGVGKKFQFLPLSLKKQDTRLWRVKDNVKRIGVNAIAGLDIETLEVFQGVVVISVKGNSCNYRARN